MTGLFARAERLIVERNYAEAISFCQLQLAASPRCVTLRLLLARALLAQRQTLTAVAQLHSCLQIDPSCAAARRLLSEHQRPSLAAARSLLDEDADRPTTPRRRVPTAPSLPPIKPVLLTSAMKRSPSPPSWISSRPPNPSPPPNLSLPPNPPPPPNLSPPPSLSLVSSEPLPPAPRPSPVRASSRRRNAFASPPADVQKPSTRWQRPLSIESRRPSTFLRMALIAVVLAGLTALWRLRPDDPGALPTAAIAPASRPAPEPPVAKPDRDLLVDVWLHPLAGPARRMPVRDSRLFGAERDGDRPTECRGGHCGIDLEGAYGEPVFAVHDGVVDRVQRATNSEHGGHYVRLAHQSGTIQTQYFHLSGIPRRLEEGAPVKAGDVIGFIGLSGIRHSEPHLHFTIAVQDPSGTDGRYLDPEPLVALWPLRASSAEDRLRMTSVPPGLARGFIRRRHLHHVAQAAPAAD